uniref:N-acetyltransferase domain-containing protein n=1 Tax=Cynoglossus semilaevis TaxID=244447 RepID=A0A3P8WS70_CYNSE
MEFSYDINQLFPERVSVLDHSLIYIQSSNVSLLFVKMFGNYWLFSFQAQQLSASITSASKLQTQRHQLYLLKDRESNGGRGVVVGFLKVGTKKLFLLVSHLFTFSQDLVCQP